MPQLQDCAHCGRLRTLEAIKDDVILHREPTEIQTGPDPRDTMDAAYLDVLQITRCKACGEPTFIRYGWFDGMDMEPDDAHNVRQIYPAPLRSEDLPTRALPRYQSMLEMLHAPDAFAVRAGILLEAICTDEHVPLRTTSKAGETQLLDLSARLDKLSKSGGLPRALTEQAHLVRKYRNLGGHDGDLHPEQQDVVLIREFVETILGFLYWGPAKLARGTAELREREERLRPRE